VNTERPRPLSVVFLVTPSRWKWSSEERRRCAGVLLLRWCGGGGGNDRYDDGSRPTANAIGIRWVFDGGGGVGANNTVTHVVWRLTNPTRLVSCRSRTVHGIRCLASRVQQYGSFCSVEYRSDYSDYSDYLDYITHINMWQPFISPRVCCRKRSTVRSKNVTR